MCFQSSQRWQGLGRGSWPQFHQEKRVGSWPVLGWLKNPTETLRPFCISETTRVTSKKTVTNLKHRHSQLIMISVVKFNIELQWISHVLFSVASCVSSCCQASFDHWLFQRVGHLEPTRPAECARIWDHLRCDLRINQLLKKGKNGCKELGKHAKKRYALITATCLEGFDVGGLKSATTNGCFIVGLQGQTMTLPSAEMAAACVCGFGPTENVGTGLRRISLDHTWSSWSCHFVSSSKINSPNSQLETPISEGVPHSCPAKHKKGWTLSTLCGWTWNTWCRNGQLRAIPNEKELKSWRFYHGEMTV